MSWYLCDCRRPSEHVGEADRRYFFRENCTKEIQLRSIVLRPRSTILPDVPFVESVQGHPDRWRGDRKESHVQDGLGRNARVGLSCSYRNCYRLPVCRKPLLLFLPGNSQPSFAPMRARLPPKGLLERSRPAGSSFAKALELAPHPRALCKPRHAATKTAKSGQPRGNVVVN